MKVVHLLAALSWAAASYLPVDLMINDTHFQFVQFVEVGETYRKPVYLTKDREVVASWELLALEGRFEDEDQTFVLTDHEGNVVLRAVFHHWYRTQTVFRVVFLDPNVLRSPSFDLACLTKRGELFLVWRSYGPCCPVVEWFLATEHLSVAWSPAVPLLPVGESSLVVPEPPTVVLVLAGGVVLGVLVHRLRRRLHE